MANKLKVANIKLSPGRFFYPPEWIVLGVNNICNLHCKMCDVGTQYSNSNFYTNLVGSSPLNMPVDLIKKIIDQAAKYYPKVKLGYAFTEPLIYPHLIESLEYADRKNIYTTITTNGLTLKKEAQGLIDSGLNELFISLDGPQEIHNKIRVHKSSFQRAVEGIKEILSITDRIKISIFCVITEWNIGYLKEFVEYFKEFPLSQIGFMHMNFTNEETANEHNFIFGENYPATVSNIEEINIDKIDLELLHKEISDFKSNGYKFPISFSPEMDSMEDLKIFYNQPGKIIGKMCNDVFSNIMIKSDGSVIPAHGRCYNIPIGNIYNESLKEIWNSKVLSKFRNDLINAGGLFPACSRCCSAFS